MNEYDGRYEIRIAGRQDIGQIMSFLNRHWRKNHIMAVDRKLFEYEFLEDDGAVNFILSIDRERGTIEALNGVLKASHDEEHLDIFGSFWKALDGNMAFLGSELIKRKKDLFGARSTIGVGDNPKTAIPLLKMMKFYTSKMKHYYILSDTAEFRIARIEYKPQITVKHDDTYYIREYKNIQEVKQVFNIRRFINSIPFKDYWYIDHRFFQYPYYQYHVYGIEKEGEAEAVFVLRNETYREHTAIRMVDYIGNQSAVSGAGLFFRELLEEEQAEYIDFYCEGFRIRELEQAGFTRVRENDANIIPNYFSPFVQENIDIYVSSSVSGTVFTKADADQDRPNAGGIVYG